MIGAVDGTLIRIRRPSIEREALFMSRKGYHALNCQVIANSAMKFTNVCASYPGSAHDSFIWRFCKVRQRMERHRENTYWLLGDFGYFLEPFLLTPVLAPQNPAEMAYILAHSRTRCVVEQTLGILKNRFR